MTADGCRVTLAQRGDFKGHARFASEGDCFLLDDLAANGERVYKVDLVEALRIGAGCGVVVIDAVDIFDEPAACAKLFGEEERREVGAAASEERDTAEA